MNKILQKCEKQRQNGKNATSNCGTQPPFAGQNIQQCECIIFWLDQIRDP